MKLRGKTGSFVRKLPDSLLHREFNEVGWASSEQIRFVFDSLSSDTSSELHRLPASSPEHRLIPGYQRQPKYWPRVDVPALMSLHMGRFPSGKLTALFRLFISDSLVVVSSAPIAIPSV